MAIQEHATVPIAVSGVDDDVVVRAACVGTRAQEGRGGGSEKGGGPGPGKGRLGAGAPDFFNDTATTEIYAQRNTLSLHDA
eukprot:COSAG03_NODE_11186_length_606_cov_1.029528_1_plen_80_part_10